MTPKKTKQKNEPSQNWTDWAAHLADVHASVAAERLRGHQSVGANHGGEQAALVNLLDGGAVHEVDHAPFIHRNTWAREREREREM